MVSAEVNVVGLVREISTLSGFVDAVFQVNKPWLESGASFPSFGDLELEFSSFDLGIFEPAWCWRHFLSAPPARLARPASSALPPNRSLFSEFLANTVRVLRKISNRILHFSSLEQVWAWNFGKFWVPILAVFDKNPQFSFGNSLLRYARKPWTQLWIGLGVISPH